MTKLSEIKTHLIDLSIEISEEELVNRYYELLDAYNSYLTCNECQSRESCKSNSPGHKSIIQPSLVVELVQCEKDRQYQHQKKIEKLLDSSRLPELFKNRTFENFELMESNKSQFNTAKKSCMDSGWQKGIVFAGPPGVGKTHLVSAIMNFRINQGKNCLFCTVPELLTDIRRVMKSDQETSELMELVKDVDYLTLDDLGAEKTSEWVAEQLFVILNARLVRKKITNITTNFVKPSELIEKLGGEFTGKRIVSRIMEMCEWVNIAGNDYRLKNKGA